MLLNIYKNQYIFIYHSIIYKHIHMHALTYIYMHIHIYTHIYIYIYMYVWWHIYIYTYICVCVRFWVGWLVGWLVLWHINFYRLFNTISLKTNHQFYFKQFSLACVHSLMIKDISIATYSIYSKSSHSAYSV